MRAAKATNLIQVQNGGLFQVASFFITHDTNNEAHFMKLLEDLKLAAVLGIQSLNMEKIQSKYGEDSMLLIDIHKKLMRYKM